MKERGCRGFDFKDSKINEEAKKKAEEQEKRWLESEDRKEENMKTIMLR